MTTQSSLPEVLEQFRWTDDEFGREYLKVASSDDQNTVEFAVLIDPGFESSNAELNQDRARFRKPIESLAANAATAADRYAHPYTSAIFLDYAATALPNSREKFELRTKAATRYADAVTFFGSSDPHNHVLAITDSIARSAELSFGPEALEPLVLAVDTLLDKFRDDSHVEFMGAIVVTLATRLGRKHRSPALVSLNQRVKTLAEEIGDLRKRGRVVIDLEQLSTLVGDTDYRRWACELIAAAALQRVGSVEPLVSASELKFALDYANNIGHPVRAELATALTVLAPSLRDQGSDHEFLRFGVSSSALIQAAESLRGLAELPQRLIGLSRVVSIPTEAERQSIASRSPIHRIASLVPIIVMGDHGPAGDTPASLADRHALEALIFRDAGIVETVCEHMDIKVSLPAKDVADLFRQADLIEDGQERLFSEIWTAWLSGQHGVALCGLFPMLEQVFRRASCPPLVLSRGRSMAVPVGATMVPHVKNAFGADVASVYEHILASEGARRNAFAHGYQIDEGIFGPLAAYCVFLLCFVFSKRVSQQT